MNEFTAATTNTTIGSQLGPNIDGKGNFLINTDGKTLSMYYAPKGDAIVFHNVAGGPIDKKMPKNSWFRFDETVHKVSFSFSVGEGLENDFMIQWNLS